MDEELEKGPEKEGQEATGIGGALLFSKGSPKENYTVTRIGRGALHGNPPAKPMEPSFIHPPYGNVQLSRRRRNRVSLFDERGDLDERSSSLPASPFTPTRRNCAVTKRGTARF